MKKMRHSQEEAYRRIRRIRMNKYNKLYLAMTDFFAGDVNRIQHFVKVHSFAKIIGE